MKRIIAAICIIIITLTLSVCEYISIKNNQKYFVESLNLCEDYISDYELNKAKKLLENLDEKWHNSERILNIFINHNEVDDIKNDIDSMQFYLKNNNIKSFWELSDKTKRQLLSIKERQLPYLRNII